MGWLKIFKVPPPPHTHTHTLSNGMVLRLDGCDLGTDKLAASWDRGR